MTTSTDSHDQSSAPDLASDPYAYFAHMRKTAPVDSRRFRPDPGRPRCHWAIALRRFVPEATPWAHFDTFAWRPAAKPGRPKGGDAMGLRAAFAMLQERYPA